MSTHLDSLSGLLRTHWNRTDLHQLQQSAREWRYGTLYADYEGGAALAPRMEISLGSYNRIERLGSGIQRELPALHA